MNTNKYHLYDPSTEFVGQITMEFSIIEEIVRDCVNILIGGKLANIVTERMTFSRMLQLLRTLYKQKYIIKYNTGLLKEVSSFLTQAQKSAERRNEVVHSIIDSDDTRETLNFIKKFITDGKGLKFSNKQIEERDLEIISDYIADTAGKAIEFIFNLLLEYRVNQISPADQAVITEQPKLFWNTVDGSYSYELQIADDASFGNSVNANIVKDIIRDTHYLPKEKLLQSKTYYWRVRPIFSNVVGFWSEILCFTIE